MSERVEVRIGEHDLAAGDGFSCANCGRGAKQGVFWFTCVGDKEVCADCMANIVYLVMGVEGDPVDNPIVFLRISAAVMSNGLPVESGHDDQD